MNNKGIIAMAYSSISITAPSSAREGEQVPISAEVKNVSAYDLLFRVELLAVKDIYAVPTPEEEIGSLEVTIGGGQSQVVSGTFIMPAWDTNVLVMVYRFIDYWDFDVSATKVVSLGAAVFDINTLLVSIMPLIMLVLVFGMLRPMLKGKAG